MNRTRLAQHAQAICQTEINNGLQSVSDLGGSVAYLSVTATLITLAEVFKGVVCQEVYAGVSYQPCNKAEWLKEKQNQWCQICQLKQELFSIRDERTRLVKRRIEKNTETQGQ